MERTIGFYLFAPYDRTASPVAPRPANSTSDDAQLLDDCRDVPAGTDHQ
jgi:hypothetical protein